VASTAPHNGDDPYWLPALRGDFWTEAALLHVANTRAVVVHRLTNGLDVPQQVLEALDEGDRCSMYDPRRFLNIDTWTADIDHDEPTAVALEERLKAEALMRVVETGGTNQHVVLAALNAGCPRHIIEDIVTELIR